MLTLHHLEYSQSFRIVWLLEELGIPYELKIYKRNEDQRAPEDFKKISPLGTSPTITDGDFALSESNAIIEYILDKVEKEGNIQDTKDLRPVAGTSMRNDYLFWFHASASSFQLAMSTDSLFRIIPTRLPWPISWILKSVAANVHSNFIDPRVASILHLAETQLTQHDFLAGSQLTAADITSVYSFDAAFTRNDGFHEEYPACKAWLDRLAERPAYKRALQKIGQDTISLPL